MRALRALLVRGCAPNSTSLYGAAPHIRGPLRTDFKIKLQHTTGPYAYAGALCAPCIRPSDPSSRNLKLNYKAPEGPQSRFKNKVKQHLRAHMKVKNN